MPKIVSLDQRITKFSVTNTRSTFTHALNNKIALHKLGHRKMLANFTQKVDILKPRQPVIIIDHSVLLASQKFCDLSSYSFNIAFYSFSAHQITFFVLTTRITNQ